MKTLVKVFDGSEIQFRDDGWFNATAAAKRFDKQPYEWLRLTETTTYIQALIRKYGDRPYYTQRRGANGGTWMHPKLAVKFARWLDVDFELWCDEQIEHIIHGSVEETNWIRLRHEAASSYKVMSDVLLEARRGDGKETQPYHYANEAKLVNWALTGAYKPLDREILSVVELDVLAKLEARNAVLIARGANRELRKELLMAMVESRRQLLS